MTASDWISLAGVVVSILVPSLGFVYATLRNRLNEANNRITAIGEKLDDCRLDLAAFKLQVAKEYASVDHLQEVERRILDGFKELKADLKSGLEMLGKQLAEHRAEERK